MLAAIPGAGPAQPGPEPAKCEGDETDNGEVAVMELGAITSQVQLILHRYGGTLTRVISDDKGTSMLLAFDEATHAVETALEMHRSIVRIPVSRGRQPFMTAIGITTGDVWIGCVGGRIRSEYTMHGRLVLLVGFCCS